MPPRQNTSACKLGIFTSALLGRIHPALTHGFHNDTTPRYDEAAAKLAEERMVAWFRTYLA
jgi:dienelactone hydrolase